MLSVVGVDSADELLSSLPGSLRMRGPLDLPAALSEQELARLEREIAGENATVREYSSFLGAGAYDHYIPALVRSMLARSEFTTSYTPYQPEISQGTLQAVFEYQTLVCQLTGMDVSNASLYDGASAVAEAVLMARRLTKRERVVVSSAVHPEYRETIRTYLRGARGVLSEALYCTEAGSTPEGSVERALGDEPACLVVQHPNFFGSLEDLDSLASLVHSKGGLFIVVVTEPVSLGLLKPPGALGADIAVGEMQSFGSALSYGGPYLGFMATRERFVRQMPGRIVGRTRDARGRRAFCLTFATREQHIRRERATSNICTNHGLCALAAAIHMVSLGRQGVKELALLNLSKAEYLKAALAGVPGVEGAFTGPTFNEFTIKTSGDPRVVLEALLKKRIIGGLMLSRFYPELDRHILAAVTETASQREIDDFAAALGASAG